jgi:hypothetical protein
VTVVGLDGRPVVTDEERKRREADLLVVYGGLLIEAFGALLGVTPDPRKKWRDREALEAWRRELARKIYSKLPRDSQGNHAAEVRFRREFIFHDEPEPKGEPL